jgi:hypothetical protein
MTWRLASWWLGACLLCACRESASGGNVADTGVDAQAGTSSSVDAGAQPFSARLPAEDRGLIVASPSCEQAAHEELATALGGGRFSERQARAMLAVEAALTAEEKTALESLDLLNDSVDKIAENVGLLRVFQTLAEVAEPLDACKEQGAFLWLEELLGASVAHAQMASGPCGAEWIRRHMGVINAVMGSGSYDCVVAKGGLSAVACYVVVAYATITTTNNDELACKLLENPCAGVDPCEGAQASTLIDACRDGTDILQCPPSGDCYTCDIRGDSCHWKHYAGGELYHEGTQVRRKHETLDLCKTHRSGPEIWYYRSGACAGAIDRRVIWNEVSQEPPWRCHSDEEEGDWVDIPSRRESYCCNYDDGSTDLFSSGAFELYACDSQYGTDYEVRTGTNYHEACGFTAAGGGYAGLLKLPMSTGSMISAPTLDCCEVDVSPWYKTDGL